MRTGRPKKIPSKLTVTSIDPIKADADESRRIGAERLPDEYRQILEDQYYVKGLTKRTTMREAIHRMLYANAFLGRQSGMRDLLSAWRGENPVVQVNVDNRATTELTDAEVLEELERVKNDIATTAEDVKGIEKIFLEEVKEANADEQCDKTEE